MYTVFWCCLNSCTRLPGVYLRLSREEETWERDVEYPKDILFCIRWRTIPFSFSIVCLSGDALASITLNSSWDGHRNCCADLGLLAGLPPHFDDDDDDGDLLALRSLRLSPGMFTFTSIAPKHLDFNGLVNDLDPRKKDLPRACVGEGAWTVRLGDRAEWIKFGGSTNSLTNSGSKESSWFLYSSPSSSSSSGSLTSVFFRNWMDLGPKEMVLILDGLWSP